MNLHIIPLKSKLFNDETTCIAYTNTYVYNFKHVGSIRPLISKSYTDEKSVNKITEQNNERRAGLQTNIKAFFSSHSGPCTATIGLQQMGCSKGKEQISLPEMIFRYRDLKDQRESSSSGWVPVSDRKIRVE